MSILRHASCQSVTPTSSRLARNANDTNPLDTILRDTHSDTYRSTPTSNRTRRPLGSSLAFCTRHWVKFEEFRTFRSQHKDTQCNGGEGRRRREEGGREGGKVVMLLVCGSGRKGKDLVERERDWYGKRFGKGNTFFWAFIFFWEIMKGTKKKNPKRTFFPLLFRLEICPSNIFGIFFP